LRETRVSQQAALIRHKEQAHWWEGRSGTHEIMIATVVYVCTCSAKLEHKLTPLPRSKAQERLAPLSPQMAPSS